MMEESPIRMRQEWVRSMKGLIAHLSDLGDRGICQACEEAMATRLLPQSNNIPTTDSAVKLCDRCADELGETTEMIVDPKVSPALEVPTL